MQVVEYTKDEALAFVNAIRLTLSGKVGFKWLVERLVDLSAYIESIASENEMLNSYLESAAVRGDYESYRAAASEALDAQAPPMDGADPAQ